MILNLTEVFLPLLLDWIAKGFLVLGCAYLTDRLLHRGSASLRHSIWLIGLGAVLLLPGISMVVPRLNVPLLRLDLFSAFRTAAVGAQPAAAPSAIEWSAADTFLVGYLAIALFVFMWQLIGRVYAFVLHTRSEKISDARITGELQRLQAVLGLKNHVQLLCNDQVSIPFSTGYLRPVIVLPRAAHSWSPSVMETILVHELAHIKRKDILTRIAAQISCCIHWINPLAWYGFGRMIMEQEIACDNQVLVSGTKASDYARNLLAFAKARRGRLDFAMTALGHRAELQQRLLEILKPTRSRTPLRSGGSLVLMMIASGFLLPVSALNLWNRSSEAPLQKPAAEIQSPMKIVQKPETAGAASGSSLKPSPDFDTAKKEFEKKIQDMKVQGVPEAELKKFSADAKAKLETLQKQILKQEEMKKQMEKKNSLKASKGKGGQG